MGKLLLKWPFIITLGFIAVMAINVSAQKQSCCNNGQCPIICLLNSEKTCRISEPNSAKTNQEPNSKQMQPSQ